MSSRIMALWYPLQQMLAMKRQVEDAKAYLGMHGSTISEILTSSDDFLTGSSSGLRRCTIHGREPRRRDAERERDGSVLL
jgi:hypothetical protein